MELLPTEALGALLGILLLFLLVFVVIYVFYLITLQNAMKQVSPELQRMRPGQVWRVFIPFYGLVWQFLMIGHIADSLGAEFRKRNLPVDNARPGYQVGMTMCILNVISAIPINDPAFALIKGLLGIGGLVCFILYWVKIAGYKRDLQNNPMIIPPQNPAGYEQFKNYTNPNQQYPNQWNP